MDRRWSDLRTPGPRQRRQAPAACPVAKIYPRRNTDGSRWYVEFAIPSCGTVHRERIDATDADRDRGYNRAEHLRQYVKTDDGDSVYDRCYGWREDAESLIYREFSRTEDVSARTERGYRPRGYQMPWVRRSLAS